MKLWLILTLPLFVLDQITKFAVLRYISIEDHIPVIPGFFYLVQVHNRGAAFGMLRDHPWIFLILASTALVVLTFITITRRVTEPVTKVAVAVLAAGVAGNLVDRLIHGHVIDFLDFILPWYGHWPSFNVADMCICVAAGLLIIASFLDGKKAKAVSSSVA